MEANDVELLRAYQRDGTEAAFVRIVERHSPWIYAAARRRLGDDHLAEDATQSVFLVFASKASQLVETAHGSIAAWLFHVMHFTCSRLRRSRSRQTTLERSMEIATMRRQGEGIADGELLLLMEESIAQLAAVDREMIVRRYYRLQQFAEIGSAFGVSDEAARMRVRRALAATKQRMLQNGLDAIPDELLERFGDTARDKPAIGNTGGLDNSQVKSIFKETQTMAELQPPPEGGHQMISVEFLVKDVEKNLTFFESLGFPRRWMDKPDDRGQLPRASLTAGKFGKIWIRRAEPGEIHPSPSTNVFFWIEGGPDGLVAFRKKAADAGIPVTPIVDEYALPNFNVSTPDGYSVAFFTSYVPPGQPPIVLAH